MLLFLCLNYLTVELYILFGQARRILFLTFPSIRGEIVFLSNATGTRSELTESINRAEGNSRSKKVLIDHLPVEIWRGWNNC